VAAIFFKYNFFIVIIVEPEAFRPAILTLLLRHDQRQNVFVCSKILLRSSPDFHPCFVLQKFLFLLGIDPAEKHGIEAHILGKPCIAF
jgi:hypothetical protein